MNKYHTRPVTNRAEWESLYLQCGQLHLTQSWAYVEAKCSTAKLCPKRLAFEYEGEVVAICAILEKHIMGIRVASRCNRGPLFLGPAPSIEQRQNIMTKLRAEWKYLIGGVLFLAPGLFTSVENKDVIRESGFWTRNNRLGWRSAYIDLCRDEEQLRKALGQKWRNQLNKAEHANLLLNVSSTIEQVDWMLERHAENMKEKQFSGTTTIAFLKALYCADPESFLVLQALFENEPIAGIILFKHGHSVEYFVGWFGPLARKLNAGNFLLWNVQLVMKQRGCRQLDLGGYSHNRGYGHFKRDMRGTEYQLLGETICF